jgi:hypothetical protein
MGGDFSEPSLTIACRTVLTLTFLRGVAGKARDFKRFAGIVDSYQLVPERAAASAAVSVLGAEGLVLIALTTGMAMHRASILGGMLLLIFNIAIAINLARGRHDLDCGCGGASGRHPIGVGILIRNGLLVMAFVPVAAKLAATPSTLDYLSGVGAGMSVFVLSLIAEASDLAQRRGAEIRTRWH